MHVCTMSQIIFDACLHDVTNNIWCMFTLCHKYYLMHVYTIPQIIFDAGLHDVTNNIWCMFTRGYT